MRVESVLIFHRLVVARERAAARKKGDRRDVLYVIVRALRPRHGTLCLNFGGNTFSEAGKRAIEEACKEGSGFRLQI